MPASSAPMARRRPPANSDFSSLDSLTAYMSSVSAANLLNHMDGRETRHSASCCCGKDGCEVRIGHEEEVSTLERDVQTAAELGQALLRRHQEAMRSAAEERGQLQGTVSVLKARNEELEVENRDKIMENRDLLSKLEDLNTSLSVSDARVRELCQDLDATHAEINRVKTMAARAEILEAQLSIIEEEQDNLRNTLTTTKEDEKAAVARWKRSEKMIEELSEQLEALSREHEIEKAKSRDLLLRLTQKRQVPVDSYASYPAAMVDRTAITRFMKEVLADNSLLQRGTSELKEMLTAAQEEVEMLREQLLENQNSDKAPLSQEIQQVQPEPPQPVKEIQIIHHHYHNAPPAPTPARDRNLTRRPKRKGLRPYITTEHFSPAPTPIPRSPLMISTQQLAPRSNRWSMQSGHTQQSSISMVDSLLSPSSTYPESSIFDRVRPTDSSRPSSAESFMHEDPRFDTIKAYHRRTASTSSAMDPPFRILNAVDEPALVPESPALQQIEQAPPSSPPILIQQPNPEEEEESFESYMASHALPGRKLRRSASHESLLAPVVEDTPIEHLLSSPSAAILSGTLHRSPAFTVSSTTFTSPQPVFTSATAKHGGGTAYNSSTYNRLLLQSGNSPRPVPAASNSSSWLWKKWNIPSMPSMPSIPSIPGFSSPSSDAATTSSPTAPQTVVSSPATSTATISSPTPATSSPTPALPKQIPTHQWVTVGRGSAELGAIFAGTASPATVRRVSSSNVLKRSLLAARGGGNMGTKRQEPLQAGEVDRDALEDSLRG